MTFDKRNWLAALPDKVALRISQALLLVLLVGVGLLLTGCGKEDERQKIAQQAMALESGEECHLCGMIIGNFPGPKGQLYERGLPGSMKFCSTRDMFAYALDPEHQHNIQSVFVHDMAKNPWDHPDEETYIDAREAFFVVGSVKKGAMGPTLASFSQQADAEAFAAEFGGKIQRFDQIGLALLSTLSHAGH